MGDQEILRRELSGVRTSEGSDFSQSSRNWPGFPRRTDSVSGFVPRRIWILFLAGCLYLVFPFIGIPYLGVSFSAPIFYLIIGEVFLRPGLNKGAINRWRLVLAALAFGLVISFIMSTILNSTAPFSKHDVVLIIRYVYWISVFAVVCILFSNVGSPRHLVKFLGISILLLPFPWLWDQAGLPGAGEEILPPNVYGFILSTFWPFALVLSLQFKSRRFYGIALGVLAGVVILNGSRGSWVAIMCSSVVVLFLLTRYRLMKFSAFPFLIFIGLAIVYLLSGVPGAFSDRAVEKWEQTSDLSRDKSWVTRKLMIQKSNRLFREHPIFGVGPGRFRRSEAELELPTILRYLGGERLNRKSAHNSYAALLAETGLVGTVPFVLFLIGLARAGVRATRHLLGFGEIWPAAILASYIGMSIHMWVVSGLTSTHVWVVYGLVAGMVGWHSRHFRGSVARQEHSDSTVKLNYSV